MTRTASCVPGALRATRAALSRPSWERGAISIISSISSTSSGCDRIGKFSTAPRISGASVRRFVAAASQSSSGCGADASGRTSLSAWWTRQRERDVRASGGSCLGALDRGRAPLDPESLTRLTVELEARVEELTPTESHAAQKDEFLARLQGHLSDVVDGASVAPFGSVVNGFWTPHSDVDVCVRVPGASTRTGQIKTLQKIAGELSRSSTHTIEARFGAEVPILHWAPKRQGMVACDISVNNVLAVANSRLLGFYTKLDDRLRKLGLCFKLWARSRGINDRSKGTLSSFALVLMLVHFLQRRSPPILPSLQDIACSRGQSPTFVAGVDCRYCADSAEIEDEMRQLRAGRPPNSEGLGQLFLQLFYFYGHTYRSGILRIRDTRSVLPPSDESRCYLVVDNPFEVGKDVANVDPAQHDFIRKEFRRARSLLGQGRPFAEVLHGGKGVLR